MANERPKISRGSSRPARAADERSVDLEASLLGLPGVGPKTAERLAARGLATRRAALLFVPRRWDDLRALTPLGNLVDGEAQTTRGEVRSCRVVFGRKRFLEVVFTDPHDERRPRLVARWFYFRAGLRARFVEGTRFLVSGTFRSYQGVLQVVHPETTLLADDEGAPAGGAIRVRYPEIEDVPAHVVARLCQHVASTSASLLADGLPAGLRERLALPSQGEALAALHLVDPGIPPASVEALNRGESPAHRRLAFDELFFLQLGLARRRAARAQDAAPPWAPGRGERGGREAVARFIAALPFSATAAQRRAIDEIALDLERPHPMNRLLQGDVGSGKTVVMYAACELAMAMGQQVAVMAPTEILAEQHARTLDVWARAGGRRMALLTASTSRPAREAILAQLQAGQLDLLVGTHALLAERVQFRALALAVIDEQHRFGVAQRAALRDKGAGARPHLLVMTATPIPRTLALTVYGDLDITILDEMPPGRRPPRTRIASGPKGRALAYAALRRALAAGRQGYVVCPLVDGNGDAARGDTPEDHGLFDDGRAQPVAEDASALATFVRLQAELPGVAIGLVHGRLATREREEAMARFRGGEVQLLVATTVIEVGVDVPTADVMLVEGADRFGLAQMHQLRGRIGRGGGDAECLLLTDLGKGSEGAARLAVMASTGDGFVIAEADLTMRGSGEIYGTRQSGLPRLRFADLRRDLEVLRQARREAFALLDDDPHLDRPEHAVTRAVLDERWSQGELFGEEAG